MPIGLVAAALIAVFELAAPAPARAPGSHAGNPAPRPSASSQPPAAPATAPATAPLSPLSRDGRWLNGLASLQTSMNNAMGSGSVVITADVLRSEASLLGRCSRELARLDHPSAQLMPVYQEAKLACIAFSQAAKYDIAAASAYTESGQGLGKFSKLLDRGTAAVNNGNCPWPWKSIRRWPG